MTALYYAFIAGIGVGFFIALGAIAVMGALSKFGENDPEAYEGYVDQDHHGHCAINRDHDGESTPARHQWRNAGAKAHHGE